MNFKITNLLSEKVLLITLLLLSIGINLLLAFEINDLRSKLIVANQTTAHSIVLGKKVSDLEVKDKNGQTLRMNYGEFSKPTIIYLYSSDCIWCERNTENINHLYNEIKDEYNFIGLTIRRDSVSENQKDNLLPFPVYTEPSDSNRVEYNLRSTPSTYLISTEGKIIEFWSGAYSEKTSKSIESFFNVKLPGLKK